MLKRDGGFTLIELTIVLALTAGLMVIAFSGQQNVRAQAEFTGAVNQLVTNLQAIRNSVQTSDVAAGDATGTGGAGTAGKQLRFGRYLVASGNTVKVTDLIATETGSGCADVAPTLSTGTTTSSTLQFGLTFKNSVSVGFHRRLCGGALNVYDLSGGANPLEAASYSETAAPTLPINLLVTDGNGRNATVTIDPTRDGAVTAVFK